MKWRAATDAIMRAATLSMGERVEITRNAVTLAVSPMTLKGIFEKATNFDETGVLGYADLENFKAMVDFKISDLKEAPQRGDLVYIPESQESFLVFQVNDDGFSRYRCLLEDV